MKFGDFLRQFAADRDPEAAAYLRSPQDRPDVARAGRHLPQIATPPASIANVPRRPLPRYRQEPLERVFPIQPALRRMPTERVLSPEHPGNYDNFADWYRSTLSRAPLPFGIGLEEAPPPVWTNPGSEQIGSNYWPVGAGTVGRGIAPADAPYPVAPNDDDEAWNAALARVRGQMRQEFRATADRLPRPGRPAISQILPRLDRRRAP